MATLTVGAGQQFATIGAAVAAAASGDTIDVQTGSYTNDFLSIQKSLVLQAVNGEVKMVETQQPPNGKAMITEGAPGILVAINGFDISGVTVADENGAAVRYEGGNLSLAQDYFHNNQDGILAAPDPNGTISINDSEFAFNGNGQGNTHNIYVNDIARFTITNSYIHDAVVGHEIKSRAQDTVIENNRIFDNNSTASYSIDLTNGGNATIAGNQIEQGPNTQNPYIIAYGEEEASTGVTNPGTTVSISNNTIVNDLGSGAVVLNRTALALSFTNNSLWGLTAGQLSNGPLAPSSTTFLTTRPVLDTSPLKLTPPPPSSATVIGSGPDKVVLQISEDAWKGNAQFTVSVDGQQIGGAQVATASHALGQSQEFDVLGTFGGGQHTVTVNFLNDAYGGTSATDRNLYVTGASIDGVAASSGLTLLQGGPQSLLIGPFPTTVTVGSGNDTLDLQISEDAWKGNAQFTVSVDGQQIGGTLIAQAGHAAGMVQDFLVKGVFGAGQHIARVTFLNDAYGGTPATDRNLYVNGASIDGQAISGSSLTLLSNGSKSLVFQGSATVTTSVISAELAAPQTVVGGGMPAMQFIGGSATAHRGESADAFAPRNGSGDQSDPFGTDAPTVLVGQGVATAGNDMIHGFVPGLDQPVWQSNLTATGEHVASSLPYFSAGATTDFVGATNLFG